jgi:hypothetical protein
VCIFEREEGEVTHLVTLTRTESLEATSGSTGEDVDIAKYPHWLKEFGLEWGQSWYTTRS